MKKLFTGLALTSIVALSGIAFVACGGEKTDNFIDVTGTYSEISQDNLESVQTKLDGYVSSVEENGSATMNVNGEFGIGNILSFYDKLAQQGDEFTWAGSLSDSLENYKNKTISFDGIVSFKFADVNDHDEPESFFQALNLEVKIQGKTNDSKTEFFVFSNDNENVYLYFKDEEVEYKIETTFVEIIDLIGNFANQGNGDVTMSQQIQDASSNVTLLENAKFFEYEDGSTYKFKAEIADEGAGIEMNLYVVAEADVLAGMRFMVNETEKGNKWFDMSVAISSGYTNVETDRNFEGYQGLEELMSQ